MNSNFEQKEKAMLKKKTLFKKKKNNKEIGKSYANFYFSNKNEIRKEYTFRLFLSLKIILPDFVKNFISELF